MSLTNEQIMAAHKANIEMLFGLTSKAFEGVEKLVELNLTASRAALSEAASNTQAAFGAKDAQELMAMQASLFQPLAEKAAAYGRSVYEITSQTSAELTKVSKDKMAEAQKTWGSAVESMTKNAPAGSEAFVNAFKSAAATGQQAFEQAQAAAQQAIVQAQDHVTDVVAKTVNKSATKA